MHALANRTLLEDMLSAGLVKGNVDEMMSVDIGAIFMPHGQSGGGGERCIMSVDIWCEIDFAIRHVRIHEAVGAA
jgi:hypothetical protein